MERAKMMRVALKKQRTAQNGNRLLPKSSLLPKVAAVADAADSSRSTARHIAALNLGTLRRPPYVCTGPVFLKGVLSFYTFKPPFSRAQFSSYHPMLK